MPEAADKTGATGPLPPSVLKALAALSTVDGDVEVTLEMGADGAVVTSGDYGSEISKTTRAALEKNMRAIVRKDGPEEERYVLGIVLEPLKEMGAKDAQDDMYSADEVRKAAYLFMQEFGNLGLQHQKYINGRVKILENWITREDSVIDNQAVAKGTWLLGVRVVDDALWQAVKDGTITGFSIGGTATRTSV